MTKALKMWPLSHLTAFLLCSWANWRRTSSLYICFQVWLPWEKKLLNKKGKRKMKRKKKKTTVIAVKYTILWTIRSLIFMMEKKISSNQKDLHPRAEESILKLPFLLLLYICRLVSWNSSLVIPAGSYEDGQGVSILTLWLLWKGMVPEKECVAAPQCIVWASTSCASHNE